MEENEYKILDQIVSVTYLNISGETYNEKNIYINFNPELYSHKVFLKVALLVANFENKQVYIKCNFFDFLENLFYFYNIEFILKRKNRLHFTISKNKKWLHVNNIATFEANSFDFMTEEIFEKIWKEYYQK